MPQRDIGRSLALLLARASLAALFLYTAYHDFGRIDATAARLGGLGYPVPKIAAIVAAIAKAGGGLSVALGGLTRLGCLALILFLLPATYSFHLPGARAGDPTQTIAMLKNLAIIGGLALLWMSGPGGFAVDARLRAAGGKR